MKSRNVKSRSARRFVRSANRATSLRHQKRQGSALMVVMVLMGMLALLGVIFYTFAAQERSNAAFYSDAAKNNDDPSLTADALFDWALEQIIVGTDPRLTNSMLWGSRHSLLSNALGFGYNGPGDLHPFNGEGVNLIYDPNGNVAVDQNRNGVPDDGTPYGGVTDVDYRYLLDYNDSPAAPKISTRELGMIGAQGERQVYNGPLYFPQSDVGYTYPDINNIFLTYVGKVRDQYGTVHQVVKPAYHVPALLRSPIAGISAPLIFEDTNFNGILDPGEDTNGNGYLDDWTVNPNLPSRIMRGHPSHIYVPSSGIPQNPSKRYLSDTEAVSLIGPSARGFPYHPMASNYTLAAPSYMPGQMGAYSSLNANPTNDAPIQFDYDNDGDKINEAILMDLDFPVQQDSSGKLFVPLFLITIHDLDALMNLNVHGNLAKILLGPADISPPAPAVSQANTPLSNNNHPYGSSNTGGTPPPFFYVSQSNLGLAPSEVNPLWALTARPALNTATPPGDVMAGSTLFSSTSQYALFYTNPPTPPTATQLTAYTPPASPAYPAWGETANMELTWAKIGRLQFSGGTVTNLLPGVYGEAYLLYTAQQNGTLAAVGGHGLPRPGVSLQDDNGDINEGQADYTPYFQHPMDYTGLGSYLQPGSSGVPPKKIQWSTLVGQNQWITYSGYETNSTVAANSNLLWGQFPVTANPSLQTPALMSNSVTQGLGDDPSEVSFYTPNSNIDSVYTPDEMLYLSVGNQDITSLNITSRLSNLMPFNFASTTTDNQRAANIRRKFTTESNDRKSFGLPTSIRALGSAAAGYAVPYLLSQNYLGQEYSLDSTSGTYKFPPQFGTGGSAIPRFQAQISSTTGLEVIPPSIPVNDDPFRIPTRHLLEIELLSQQSNGRLQRKLSINKYLSNDLSAQLQFRELTPHPTDPGAASVDSASGYNNYPPTSAASQEFWARNDRQKMCRDIYVLLYLTGHGDDNVDTATTSNNPTINPSAPIYTDQQLREMAQFAVNLVDGMDRDSVITRFEYDKDLSDGWNLDDDPYGTFEVTPYTSSNPKYDNGYPNDSATRGEVFGIERLDLTIGEALVIKVTKNNMGMNLSSTNFDESTNDRYFFYVELRNHGPQAITFDAKETWQVVLRQEAAGGTAAWERSVSFKGPSITIYPTTDSGTNYPFVIGSADAATASSGLNRSTFAVDPTGGSSLKQIVPNRQTTCPQPQCDLDMIETGSPSSVFRVLDQSGNDLTSTPGAMLSAFTGGTANMTPGSTVKVLLRRRAHPTRTAMTPSTDNPFVEVDSMMLTVPGSVTTGGSGKGFDVFQLTGTSPPGSTIQTQLNFLSSLERPEPLGGATEAVNSGSPFYNVNNGMPPSTPATILNSLGTANSITPQLPAVFSIWQPHFDRNYASLMDLLLLPIFGPHQLTKLSHAAMTEPPDSQVDGTHAVPSGNWTVGGTPYTISAKTAASRIMVPEDHTNVSNPSPTPATNMLNNRWHRILEFLEVPTRTNVNLGSGTDLTIPRVPGRMNLNMIRNPENLGGLIDDSGQMYLDLVSSNLHAPSPLSPDPDAPSLDSIDINDIYGTSGTDAWSGTVRDWWGEFLRSRDPYDPYFSNTSSLNVPIPGLPSSRLISIPGGGFPPDARPFRNIADVGYTTNTTTPGVAHPSVADTVLRYMPMDRAVGAGVSQRMLLEIGTAAEHQNSSTGMTPYVDPYVRNRILAKISQNSTTRSNCFGIFISVKLFSAAEQNGAIRIGGPYNGNANPEYRGFFVVDRSKLENGQMTNGPTYNFRSFVDYRKTLQTQ